MDKDIKKLKKLVDFMRKQGVLYTKLENIELELSPSALFPEENKQIPEENKETLTSPPMTDLELALWSAPSVDFQS